MNSVQTFRSGNNFYYKFYSGREYLKIFCVLIIFLFRISFFWKFNGRFGHKQSRYHCWDSWLIIRGGKARIIKCKLYYFFTLKICLLIMLLQLSHFPLSLQSILPTSSLPLSSLIVHVRGSYIQVLWLLHFPYYSYLPLPIFLLPFMLLILCTFPSSLPLPLPC